MTDRSFAIALLLVVLLSLLCFSSAQGMWELGFALGVVAGAGWMYTRRGSRGLPRWVMGVILGLLVVYSTLEVMEPGGSRVSPFTTFLASVATLKMWERRRIRDDAQVLGIAVFLDIGAILASAERKQADLVMGVLLFAVVPALVYAAVLLQIRAAAGRARGEGRESVPDDLDVERRAAASVRRLSLGLVLAGLAIATALFVLIPRPIGPRGWRSLGPRMSVTSFRDRIDLGNAGLLSQSQAIALRVTYAERGDSSAVLASVLGTHQELYLRGAVLDRYNGGSWRSSADADALDVFVPRENAVFRLGPNAPRSIRLLVRDLAALGGTRPLFAPWRARSVFFPRDARGAGTALPASMVLNTTTGAALFERPEGELRYEVEVVRPFITSGTAESPRMPVDFPFPESVRVLARQALSEAGVEPDGARRAREDDARAVRALEQAIRDRCSYSREVRAAPPDADPTAWFLESERRGHCEYFASALAATCRAVGINARVITGYVSSELDEDDRTYTVRQAGAHAWVEAEVAPGIWRVFDATPEEEMSRLLGEKQDFLGVLDRWLVGLEAAWLSGFVQFDDQVRRSLIDPDSEPRSRRSTPSGVAQVRKAVREHRALAWSLAGVAAVAGALWAIKRWRSRPPGPNHGELGRLHRGLLRALRGIGGRKAPWQGTLEYVDGIAGLSHALGAAARPIVEVCYRAWFGGARPTPEEVRFAWEALARLRAEARRPVG